MTTPDLYVDLYAALFALRRDEPARYDNEFITRQLELAVNGPSPEQYAANLRLFDPDRTDPLDPEDNDETLLPYNSGNYGDRVESLKEALDQARREIPETKAWRPYHESLEKVASQQHPDPHTAIQSTLEAVRKTANKARDLPIFQLMSRKHAWYGGALGSLEEAYRHLPTLNDKEGYRSQKAAQDFLNAEMGNAQNYHVEQHPNGSWQIKPNPKTLPSTTGPATVPFAPKLQGSIRDVIDAAMHIGDSESERITGPGGLSGATTEQLNQILALAKQRGWKGQPTRFSQEQQTRDWNDEGRWTAGKIDPSHPRYQAFLQSPERKRRLDAAQAEHRRLSAIEKEEDPEVTMIRREIAQGKA